MKNKLSNVSDMLIAQMERLNDESYCIDDETVERETAKAKALVELSQSIVNIGLTQLKAMETADKCGMMVKSVPQMFLDSKDIVSNISEIKKESKNEVQ